MDSMIQTQVHLFTMNSRGGNVMKLLEQIEKWAIETPDQTALFGEMRKLRTNN